MVLVAVQSEAQQDRRWCDAMSTDVFAFRNSTAETSEGGIISVMNEMKVTITDLRSGVSNLEPHWIADEADAYYECARKFNDSADDVVGILSNIEEVLEGVRNGTKDLRKGIWDILSESQ